MSEIEIDPKDSGKSWQARPGDTIQVRLPENPTTGYRWEAVPGQATILRLVSSNYSPSAPIGLGSGGTHTFTFQALYTGSDSIRLVLKRPWGSGEAKEEFTAYIQVD